MGQGTGAEEARRLAQQARAAELARLLPHALDPANLGAADQAARVFSSRPLTLAEVMAALAYHYDDPEELEAYLGRGHDAEDEYDTRRAEYLRQRSGE